ncbi:hypothetical protein ACFVYF_10880 [Streptomyces sp. NPDC058274]|uniref:hypothetical protein n=1 Tax=Streptomyces sp. NPDC058274 TaxID=3346416 RepID=UPI0036EB09D3
MNKKRKLALAAVAALLAAVPATLVIQDRIETAERKSLEQAAQKIFQRDADRTTAEWRGYEPPSGKVWDRAVAKAVIAHVEMQGDRAKVWVDEFTTPYATDPSGKDSRPTEPSATSHLFLFEPAGDSWRLAKDLTKSEAQQG